MSKKMPILYGALTLTGVNLLLRFAGTSFQVYISSVLGPAGVGLLQLVLSVGSLAMTAGIAGIRTTAMYLTAGALGRKQTQNVPWLLSGCFVYCLVTGGTMGGLLHHFAPLIAEEWIRSPEALPALHTFAAFLPLSCLCGVMTGYFTAANRIGTLAAVEVAEQCLSMAVTAGGLALMPPNDPAHACRAVVFGSCVGNLLTMICLLVLYCRQNITPGPRIPVARDILTISVPLALADDLKAGISSLENLMVPRRLGLFAGIADPLAAFGIVSGMVFPVMMFPAAILFSLSELLIPELARCAASGSRRRIRYLVRRNLRVSLFFGLICGGILFLVAAPLCRALYPGIEVGGKLKAFCFLVPMLYCDAVTDGMTKGLGQQTWCVRYNILTNSLDVCLLYFLLPQYGLSGYFFSFTVTHLLNFILSLRRLVLVSRIKTSFHIPALAFSAALTALWLCSRLSFWQFQVLGFLAVFVCLCTLAGVFHKGDLKWLKGLIRQPPGHKS